MDYYPYNKSLPPKFEVAIHPGHPCKSIHVMPTIAIMVLYPPIHVERH
jgi:hypothetical protein